MSEAVFGVAPSIEVGPNAAPGPVTPAGPTGLAAIPGLPELEAVGWCGPDGVCHVPQDVAAARAGTEPAAERVSRSRNAAS